MKILVVVDMQNDFIDGALGTKEAIAIVPSVVEKIQTFDGEFAITHDTHGSDYLTTQEGVNLPVVHCVDQTTGWKLNDDVFGALNARFLESGARIEAFFKPTFGSTELADWIVQMDKKHGVEEVVLIGLCTDICVISNAMLIKAFAPEIKITVDAACCAGVTPESHTNALAAMKMCQINIEDWEE